MIFKKSIILSLICLILLILLPFYFIDFYKENEDFLLSSIKLETNQFEQIQIIDKSNKSKGESVYESTDVKDFINITRLLKNIPKVDTSSVDNKKVIYELYIANKGYSSNPPVLILEDSISFRGNTTYLSTEKINTILNEIKIFIQNNKKDSSQ